MIDLETVRKLALSFPESTEQDHWGRPSFRVKKKIFLTLWPAEKRAVVKLSAIDQSVFCDYNETIFYPVTGAWGKQGWTNIELKKVRKNMFVDALNLSWQGAAPKSLLKTNQPEEKHKSNSRKR
ncbi:MAG TPA: MmcQ/YjbR family DNA-binding protein [Ohtaekwangia sp.]|uniref:MmcQ/YjbR family DNA-binding protein n=1 Tax=Ohtaekwangia sp. TaxID=2066019 RepID=UPI002F94B613